MLGFILAGLLLIQRHWQRLDGACLTHSNEEKHPSYAKRSDINKNHDCNPFT